MTSVLWPEGNWSLRLLLGFILLTLPAVAAIRAVLRGIGALTASQTDV